MIGVELLTRYVQSLLPYSELQNDGFGARSPDTTQDSSMTLHRVVTSAADSDRSQSGVFAVDMQSESGGWTRFDGWRCYASVVPLSLYSRNAPFSEGSHWMLVGTVSTTRLFAFSRSAQEWLVITILLTVLVGLLGCLFSSRRLAGPITRLSDEVAASAKDTGVTLLIETNGVYSDTKRLRALLDKVNCREVAALWDIHHPYRFAHETPETTIENLGSYIKYVHVKDSIMEKGQDGKKTIKYRMMGFGDMPIPGMLHALREIGYEGYISLEWVKRWAPEIDDCGIVFPQFANYMREHT